MKLGQMPLVIQFNKRDLPDVRPDAELANLARGGKEPVFAAVATSGSGVLETFMGLLHVTYGALDTAHKLKDKFGIGRAALLADIGNKLGAKVPAEHLLKAALGGALDASAGGPGGR